MKHGSLFDGSGGFPLAGRLEGFEPVWASEIEPFPIRVTRKNFPEMKHLGDIRNINGGEIEPVDVLTFSSPCQNLSISGRRSGLKGTESSLFYEAIRVIKEMRVATEGKYPKFAVWENVCGAFSSKRGEDFRCVLEEICGITNPHVSIPKPKKWCKSGYILGRNSSLAWRTLDSQYWGVPQRRKRIFLVADFRGDRAGKILFNSESGRWNPPAGKREGTAYPRAGIASLDESNRIAIPIENHGQDSRITVIKDGICQTLTSWMGTGGNNVPLLYEQPYASSKGWYQIFYYCDVADTLMASDYKDPPSIYRRNSVRRLIPLECARLQGFPDDWCDNLEIENPTEEEIRFWKDVFKAVGKIKTDKQIKAYLSKPPADAAQYKMWGNGVALPCVQFIMHGIAEELRKEELLNKDTQ